MSKDNPVERPDEMTDEERQRLKESHTKADADARARALEEAEGRPLNYILVRHMGRSPRTRTLRAARAGYRRQGILLKNGKRLRKKGKKRFTQLDQRDLVDNHTRLLEFVRAGALEFCNPRSQDPIPYNELCDVVLMLGAQFAEKDGTEFFFDDGGLEVIEGAEHTFNTAPSPASGILDDNGQDIGDDFGKDTPSAEDEDNGLTEEQMLDMRLDDLKALAISDYGCEEESTSKMRSKKEVATAIFAAAAAVEEEE